MAQHYRYNPHRLRYEPVSKGPLYLLRTYGLYIITTALMAVVALVVVYAVYDSPRVRQQKAQNAKLSAAVASYSVQIDTLKAWVNEFEHRNRNLYREILNADPIELQPEPALSDSLKKIFEGTDNLEAIETRLSALEGRVEVQGSTQEAMVAMAEERKDELARIPSIRPVATEIISGFGTRRHPIFKKDFDHQGIDFKADLGSPIYATADGWVLKVGTPDKGLGLMIVLDHRNDYETRYAHLDRSVVKAGQRVRRGQLIGYSGESGLCKGPHLYYEIRKAGVPIDPIDFFFHDLTPDQLIEARRKAAQYNESMG
ncbi:MAG: M23 family metallopeptidase [Bacteroidia bacterium]|nr:M23 family metallopeptidase [Bacteroidia bacterium]